MSSVRRLGWVAVAAVLVLAAVVPAASAASSPQACEHSCGTATAAEPRDTQPSCAHDARCAGGGALTSSPMLLLLGVVTVGAVAAAVIALRARVSNRTTPRFDTLLAARLFHPPRLVAAR